MSSKEHHPSDLIRARDLEGVDVWTLPSFDPEPEPVPEPEPEPEPVEEEIEEVPLEEVQPLTLESLQTAQPARGGTITKGGVGQKGLVRRSQAPERCALPVRHEQDDLVTLPLGQHHPAIVQQTAPLPDLDFAAQCPLVIEEPEQRVSPGGHRMQLIFGIELIMRAVATTPHMLEPTQGVVFKRTTLIIIQQIAIGVILECHVPR